MKLQSKGIFEDELTRTQAVHGMGNELWPDDAVLVGVVTYQVLQLMYFWSLEIESVNSIQLSDNWYWK